MAWGWWRRRRRGWLRSFWRRRAAARRRSRWIARRARRRRVRRKRRWRRRRGRRRRFIYRKKRRYRRRRKRQKIIIKQWQPAVVRRCRIVGYMAALISGNGTFATNYSSHLEDRIQKGPFGGGHSTMRFSLYVLYQEHLRHMNYWTYTNKDLELTRYLGATLTFYRHPTRDFIVTYSRRTPLGGNILTAPSLHPGNAMLSKRKILIPSLETRPKGKKTKKLKIGPPTLLIDKWYFQKDFSDVTLFNLNVTEADLRFPFCSPQTDNICVSFQVLKSCYNNYLAIHVFDNDTSNTKLQTFFNEALPTTSTKNTEINVLNTFRTQGCLSHPQVNVPNANSTPNNQVKSNEYFQTLDGLWGNPIYANSRNNEGSSSSTFNKKTFITKYLIGNMKSYWHKFTTDDLPQSWRGNKAHCHLTGIYSPPYLNSGRISPEIFGLYTEIIYNPYTDKGKGNKIWVDALTKGDNIYSSTQSKCLLQDLPLWCACFGYTDWIKKELNHWDAPWNYRLLMVCPYTYPKLYNDANPNYGYVCFSYQFGAGQMPDGSSYVPIKWRGKWYPNMIHQQKVMEDLARSGPFAPKQQTPSVQLSMKYKFSFNWGGNPILEQIVRDPSTQPTYEIPGAGNLPTRVQVIDPRVIGPQYSFRSWDWRRGQFNEKSIKRIAEQQETSEYLFSGPKRPRIDQRPYNPEEESWSSTVQQREPKPWTSEEETESQSQSEEEGETSVREQLQQQLQEQHRIRQGIKCLFEQLVRTQQGVHLHPSLV
nr:MAG: ORF1 [Torque teno virus]